METSSPYKNKLTEDLEKKRPRKRRKRATRRRKPEKSKTQLMGPQETGNRKYQILRTLMISSKSSSFSKLSTRVAMTTQCPYCQELFSTDKCGEKLITCIKCHQWCHEECSGADDYKKFIRAFCIDG
jgi:hypothetical protein